MFYTLVSGCFKKPGSTLPNEAKYCICTLRTGIGVYKISKSLIPECVQSGDIVHFLRLTYRKVDPCNGF